MGVDFILLLFYLPICVLYGNQVRGEGGNAGGAALFIYITVWLWLVVR